MRVRTLAKRNVLGVLRARSLSLSSHTHDKRLAGVGIELRIVSLCVESAHVPVSSLTTAFCLEVSRDPAVCGLKRGQRTRGGARSVLPSLVFLKIQRRRGQGRNCSEREWRGREEGGRRKRGNSRKKEKKNRHEILYGAVCHTCTFLPGIEYR